jgi:hypothetical protein
MSGDAGEGADYSAMPGLDSLVPPVSPGVGHHAGGLDMHVGVGGVGNGGGGGGRRMNGGRIGRRSEMDDNLSGGSGSGSGGHGSGHGSLGGGSGHGSLGGGSGGGGSGGGHGMPSTHSHHSSYHKEEADGVDDGEVQNCSALQYVKEFPRALKAGPPLQLKFIRNP